MENNHAGCLTPISGNAANYAKQREAQFRHFCASYRRAIKNFPDGFTIDCLGNIVKIESGYVVAEASYNSLAELTDNGFNFALVTRGESLPIKYITALRDSFFRYAFGYWRNQECCNGNCHAIHFSDVKEYFERVRIYSELSPALEYAASKGEKAIYSFADSQYLDVAANRALLAIGKPEFDARMVEWQSE